MTTEDAEFRPTPWPMPGRPDMAICFGRRVFEWCEPFGESGESILADVVAVHLNYPWTDGEPGESRFTLTGPDGQQADVVVATYPVPDHVPSAVRRVTVVGLESEWPAMQREGIPVPPPAASLN
jgi:hypothetical protein